VFKNIVHVTVAGVVGAFIYDTEATDTVCACLKRSCTTSFGSICLGSLVVSTLLPLRMSCRTLATRNTLMMCICVCILGFIEMIFSHMNKWGFYYIALYGKSFVDSSTSVLAVIDHRLFREIVADDPVEYLLTMCTFGIGEPLSAARNCICHSELIQQCPGLFNAGFGVLVGYLAFGDLCWYDYGDLTRNFCHTVVGCVWCLCIGVCAPATLLSVIEAAALTIFDPVTFHKNHPKLFHLLILSWQSVYGHALALEEARYFYGI
ncbi:TPA: hypothetical protein N0F65_007159, partial [Lagenidium giganteum]